MVINELWNYRWNVIQQRVTPSCTTYGVAKEINTIITTREDLSLVRKIQQFGEWTFITCAVEEIRSGSMSTDKNKQTRKCKLLVMQLRKFITSSNILDKEEIIKEIKY